MLLGQNENAAAPSADIFDVTTDDFEQRVLLASMETPVLADFWAPWCGPCKQLTPVLEDAIRAAGGKVKLAKINIDDNPELAQALRIQSVPAVYAFLQGRPVDAFVGLRAPGEIKAFIDKLVQAAQSMAPEALDIPAALSEAAALLSAGDLQGAQGIYIRILEQDENNVQAYTGVVRSFIVAGMIDEARGMIEDAPDGVAAHPDFAAARTALELAANKPDDSAVKSLQDRLAKKPDDHEARFDLAGALFAAGQKEQAIDELVEIIRRDRSWQDEKARKQLLQFFEALGPADPLCAAGRRKLSAVLFS